jgi:hypothetical protein
MANKHQSETVRRSSQLGVGVLAACAAAWLVAALPSLTDVGVGYPLDLFLVGTWCMLAQDWVRLAHASPAEPRLRPCRRMWLTAGTIIVLGAVLALTDLGLRARLYLCERQVAAYAAGVVPRADEYRHEPRKVGLFQVEGTMESHGMVTLNTTSGFVDRRPHGLVYAPGHEGPLVYGKLRTSHLYGPWYAFR